MSTFYCERAAHYFCFQKSVLHGYHLAGENICFVLYWLVSANGDHGFEVATIRLKYVQHRKIFFLCTIPFNFFFQFINGLVNSLCRRIPVGGKSRSGKNSIGECCPFDREAIYILSFAGEIQQAA